MMDKRKRIVRTIGIICWVLVLLLLFRNAREKRELAQQEQETIASEMQAEQIERAEDEISTIILSSE